MTTKQFKNELQSLLKKFAEAKRESGECVYGASPISISLEYQIGESKDKTFGDMVIEHGHYGVVEDITEETFELV